MYLIVFIAPALIYNVIIVPKSSLLKFTNLFSSIALNPLYTFCPAPELAKQTELAAS